MMFKSLENWVGMQIDIKGSRFIRLNIILYYPSITNNQVPRGHVGHYGDWWWSRELGL